MKNSKFYLCPRCGNLLEVVHSGGVAPDCCGYEMLEMKVNSADASGEKHTPAVTIHGSIVEVNVGSIDHPMEQIHWFEWVQLNTNKGTYRRRLNPGQTPRVLFQLNNEQPLAVYAYCNLHGLWKTELN
jgi:superoxide reductase